MIVWPAKDPADIADYTWQPSLDTGDTIATFTAVVTSGTVTQPEIATHNGQIGAVWLAGGIDAELAIITLTVTTNGGRVFKDAAVVPVFSHATEALAIFRLRYPEFASTLDGQVSYWLYDGLTMAADWTERDAAITAYAAHQIAMAANNAAIGALPMGVTSFKSGVFSAEISDTKRTGFSATNYGVDFLAIATRCIGGIHLVSGNAE
jgi:hypothetical protein